MISLVIPSYGGGVNLERTIASVASVCDEVIIISTALFEEDKEHFRRVSSKVVELPWNFTFLHGHGSLHNQAAKHAKNDWLLLFGVAETLAEQYKPIHRTLSQAQSSKVFRCNHHNDIHSWKRIWNRNGGTEWSGIIHEEIHSGEDGGVIFRMQDTEKTPSGDLFKDEVRRWVKTLSYNLLYRELLLHPKRLGAAGLGWLSFVAGAKETILAFCETNKAMLDACIAGELEAFLRLVADTKEEYRAYGVNFKPQGYEHLIEKP